VGYWLKGGCHTGLFCPRVLSEIADQVNKSRSYQAGQRGFWPAGSTKAAALAIMSGGAE
ncbi:MAG: hypothetical protein RIQ68_1521, partial [Pseudomonadota bacterium]